MIKAINEVLVDLDNRHSLGLSISIEQSELAVYQIEKPEPKLLKAITLGHVSKLYVFNLENGKELKTDIVTFDVSTLSSRLLEMRILNIRTPPSRLEDEKILRMIMPFLEKSSLLKVGGLSKSMSIIMDDQNMWRDIYHSSTKNFTGRLIRLWTARA